MLDHPTEVAALNREATLNREAALNRKDALNREAALLQAAFKRVVTDFFQFSFQIMISLDERYIQPHTTVHFITLQVFKMRPCGG